MSEQEIQVGDTVAFDSDAGVITGTVIYRLVMGDGSTTKFLVAWKNGDLSEQQVNALLLLIYPDNLVNPQAVKALAKHGYDFGLYKWPQYLRKVAISAGSNTISLRPHGEPVADDIDAPMQPFDFDVYNRTRPDGKVLRG